MTLPPNLTLTWDPVAGAYVLTTLPASPPATTGVQAARIADLLERFGVNSFSSTSATANMWGAYPADYSQASVIAALNWLTNGSGLVMRVREYHYASRRIWQEPWCKSVHAATGSRFNVAIGGGGGVVDATSIASMASASSLSDGWLDMVEGQNEPNTDFGSGQIPPDVTVAGQKILAAGAAATIGNPHPARVLGPSVVFGFPFPEGWIVGPPSGYFSVAQMIDIQANAAFANAHLYPPTQVDQPGGSGRGSYMRDMIAGMKVAYGDRPVQITEAHTTLFGSSHNLDPVYDAYYAACYLLSAFRAGVDAVFWYALFDYGTTYLSGLFPKTGAVAPRPVANTIRAMFTLTGDTGPAKRTFAPGRLDYTIDGLVAIGDTGGQHLLFQNSAGVFFLFVWKAQVTPEGATTPVTVRLGKQVSSVRDYKVSDAVAPMTVLQSVTGISSITVPLNGSVHLLRIMV